MFLASDVIKRHFGTHTESQESCFSQFWGEGGGGKKVLEPGIKNGLK